MSSATSLAAQIASDPYRFEFVQLMRILEAASPDRALIGTEAPPYREFARLLVHSSNVFPAAEVYDLVQGDDPDDVPRVWVTFLGLTGCVGVLPSWYTELLLARLADKDATLRDFLNLFNHRLLALFYRAWDKYRFWIHEERARRRQTHPGPVGSGRKPVNDVLLAHVGLLTPGLLVRNGQDAGSPRLALAGDTFRFYSGVLSSRRRPAANLERMLSTVFGWAVAVDQFVGRWLRFDASEQTRLSPGSPAVLGVTAVVGSKVWDVQSLFRVMNGPLDDRQFESLLPPGKAHRPLVELTRYYAGPEFDFSLGLILWSRCVPPCRVGQAEGLGTRLGWNSWLSSRPAEAPTVCVEIRVRAE